MSGLYGSSSSLPNKRSTSDDASESQKLQPNDEESFYTSCRAAYLTVFKSSLDNIADRQQLCLVLQQAGLNPSNRTLSRYWTARTKELNFDDFCAIVKREKPAAKTDLLKAFRKLDPTNKGYILHDEFTRIFTTKGEKMSPEEVSAILRLADVSSGGKLDYNKFCNTFFSTCDQCAKAAVEKMETNSRAKRQQFGSQIETSPERSPSPRNQRFSDGDTTPRKVESKSSRPSSARNYKGTSSTVINMGAVKNSRYAEPSDLQEISSNRSPNSHLEQLLL